MTEREDSKIVTHNDEDNSFTISYEIEPYIPVGVFKTFVKMAISVMPNENLVDVAEAIQWILDPNHTNHLIKPAIARQVFIPGPKPIDYPISILLKKKTNIAEYPSYIFLVGFGNVMYEIAIPTRIDVPNLKKGKSSLVVLFSSLSSV